MSGWPKLIAPFLAQNIGWFVGGFCFVAGALFLIANTSGFVNALVVFASLFGTTAFLLWAGYQFRRKGSDLAVASSVLLTLAMLLAPLDLAVAVRLTSASGGDSLLLIISLLDCGDSRSRLTPGRPPWRPWWTGRWRGAMRGC